MYIQTYYVVETSNITTTDERKKEKELPHFRSATELAALALDTGY